MPRRVGAAVASATVILAGLSLPVAHAAAEDAPGRYTMTPTEGGFIRLDTQTGSISMCSGREGQWACRAMPDDQKALQDRVTKLEEENRALKLENKRLEDVLGLNPDKPKADAAPAAPGDQAPSAPPGKGFKLPSEKDVDQAFDYFESLLKKFRERLKKMEEKPGGNGVPL